MEPFTSQVMSGIWAFHNNSKPNFCWATLGGVLQHVSKSLWGLIGQTGCYPRSISHFWWNDETITKTTASKSPKIISQLKKPQINIMDHSGRCPNQFKNHRKTKIKHGILCRWPSQLGHQTRSWSALGRLSLLAPTTNHGGKAVKPIIGESSEIMVYQIWVCLKKWGKC